MLGKVIRQLWRSHLIDDVAIATTTSPADGAIDNLAVEYGSVCTRGAEFDVLHRFEQTARLFPAVHETVRVTADCPFIDPDLVDEAVAFRREERVDYASNQPPGEHDRTLPIGLPVECFSRELLERTWREAQMPFERQHVTTRMYSGGTNTKALLTLLEDLWRLPLDGGHPRGS